MFEWYKTNYSRKLEVSFAFMACGINRRKYEWSFEFMLDLLDEIYR